MTILNRLAAYKTTLKWSPIMAQRSGVPELGLMTQMSAQHQESITQALRPFSLVSEPNLTGFNPTSIHNDDFLNPVLQPRTPFLTAAEIANPATISQPRREFIKILSWYQKTAFSYLNKRDRQKAVRQGSDLIIRAFLMAEEAHAGVPRNMGEPYIFHPIELCKLARENSLCDAEALAAYLLHDVPEDNPEKPEYSIKSVRKQFGPAVAAIVKGLTKFYAAEKTKEADEHSKVATIVRILSSIGTDPRIIVGKLFDVHHNLKTIAANKREKQIVFAQSALDIWAPVADGMGLRELKNEIENLAYAILYPDDCVKEQQEMGRRRALRSAVRVDFLRDIKRKLKLTYGDEVRGMYARVTGWNIWETRNRRLERPHVEGEPWEAFPDVIYGAASLAIVVPDNLDPFDVYRALAKPEKSPQKKGVFQFRKSGTGLRDLVNAPKANGYQALIFEAEGPDGITYNLQVQTNLQYQIGRRGVIYYIAHKLQTGSATPELIELRKRWAESVLERIKASAVYSQAAISHDVKGILEMITVYDEAGIGHQIPKGATLRDFAFTLGVPIGVEAVGADIVGVMTTHHLGQPAPAGRKIVFHRAERRTPPLSSYAEVRDPASLEALKKARRQNSSECIRTGRELLAEHLRPLHLTVEDILGIDRIGRATAKKEASGKRFEHGDLKRTLAKLPLGSILFRYLLSLEASEFFKSRSGNERRELQLTFPEFVLFLIGAGEETHLPDGTPIPLTEFVFDHFKSVYQIMESTTPLPMESRKVRFRFQAENRPGIYAAMLSRFSDDLNVQFNFEAQRLFSRRRKSGGMSVDMVEVSFNLELKDRLQLTQARNIITRALAGKGRIIEEAFVIELPERL